MALQDNDLFLVNRGGESFKTEYSTLKSNIIDGAEVGVGRIIAGENVTISPADGKGEVTISSDPGVKGTIGAIVAWGNSTVPEGWLECNGSAIPSQYSELIALVGTNTPDLRGMFVRGWDNGRGVDGGRDLLSFQDSENLSHDHTASDSGHQHGYVMAQSRTLADGGANGTYAASSNTNTGYANITVNYSGGSESRPKNVALMYIINAGGNQIGGTTFSGGGVPEAPLDGQQYGRQNGDWTVITGGGGGGGSVTYSGAAAWGVVSSAGSATAGLNVKETARTATGVYTVEFITPMPNANYAVALGGSATECRAESKTANGFTVKTFVSDGSADDYSFDFAVHALDALPPKSGTGADAWVNVAGDTVSVGQTPTILASYNIASVVKSADGTDYLVTFQTPMPTANYAVTACVSSDDDRGGIAFVDNKTKNGFIVNIRATNGGNADDTPFSAIVHATNATIPYTVTQAQIEAAVNNPGVSAWADTNSDKTIKAGLNLTMSNTGNANQYVYTFQTPMPSADYAVAATIKANSLTGFARVTDQSATGFTIVTNENNNGAVQSTALRHSVIVTATNALPPRGGAGADCFGSVVSNALATSFNVGSLQNPENGRYTIMFETPMPTANYSVTCTAGITNFKASMFNKTVNGFDIYTVNIASGIVAANVDFDFVVHATNAQLPDTVTQEQIDTAVEVGDMFSVAGDFINTNNNKGLNIVTTGLNQGTYSKATGASAYYGIQGHAESGNASQYGVYGTVQTNSAYSSGGGLFYSINNNTYAIAGYWSGTQYYSIYGNGAVGGSSFPNTSDARLKDVELELDGADCLEKLGQLKAVKYQWKEGSDARKGSDKIEIGLLAQDVEKVFPEVVTRTEVNKPTEDAEDSLETQLDEVLSVDYGRLTAVLIEALNEANTRIKALEAKLEG